MSLVKSCPNCNKLHKNPKYCSRSCSVTVNNKIPKRIKKIRYCKYCNNQTYKRLKICDNCKLDWSKRTVGEYRNRLSSFDAYKSIREHARSMYKNRPICCINCGYTKHTEICHIISISDFPDETPITIINALTNLVSLCPNCHWELDHDWLTIAKIKENEAARIGLAPISFKLTA